MRKPSQWQELPWNLRRPNPHQMSRRAHQIQRLARKRQPCNRFNSSKIRALEARCNHSHKHQSIAGVKEQGVYLSTLTTEYPPSLALQLAQVGVGRVSKTGSFRQKLPLHSNFFRPIALAPCRLPTCDGAGMHSSAADRTPAASSRQARKLVPRILAHMKSGSPDSPDGSNWPALQT